MYVIQPSRSDKSHSQGYILISFMIIITVGFVILVTALQTTVTNFQSTTQYTTAENLTHAAEAGIENALLQLSRNPAYTGETFNLDDISVSVQVQTPGSITITSTSTQGSLSKTIQTTGNIVNYNYQPETWQDITSN